MSYRYSDNPFADPVEVLDYTSQTKRPIHTLATIVRFDEKHGVYHMSDGSQIDSCDGCGAFPRYEVTATYTESVTYAPATEHYFTCGSC
jgi:hypothetical protein